MKTKREKLFTRRMSNIFHAQKRRARAAGQELDYTLAQLRQLVSQLKCCPYCDAALTEQNFEIDHQVPICRGGTFQGRNCLPCCAGCYGAKVPLSSQEYRLLLLALNGLAEQAKQNILARLKAGGRIVKGL